LPSHGVRQVIVPGSLAEGAGPAFIIPADCKVLEMAWEIMAVSSVGLNCYVESVGDNSGRAMATLTAQRHFAGTTSVGLFAAWLLEA